MHEAQSGFARTEALMIADRGFEEGPGAAASATPPKDSCGRSLEEDHEAGKGVDTIVEETRRSAEISCHDDVLLV
jgi:hypothetical protein